MIVGVFVGGKSRRMGGAPKGLLPAPDGSAGVAQRLARVAREALPECRVVLVGDAAPYAALGLLSLPDAPSGIGPLGGLAALLTAADGERAIALACDLPYVEPALIARLAAHAPDHAAVVPRVGGVWQPLCARYAAAQTLVAIAAALAANERSLQRVIARLGDRVAELPLAPGEDAQLRDWDSPADL